MANQRAPRQRPVLAGDYPLAYFITFRTYGTWLHGDARGSTDRAHNAYASPRIAPNQEFFDRSALRRVQPAVHFGPEMRALVEQEVLAYAGQRDWPVHALAVQTEHVHVVISANTRPELVMNAIKSRSTRQLRDAGLVAASTRVWSRHGSTRYLWTDHDVEQAGTYVLLGQ